jgi:hypothetical protein
VHASQELLENGLGLEDAQELLAICGGDVEEALSRAAEVGRLN